MRIVARCKPQCRSQARPNQTEETMSNAMTRTQIIEQLIHDRGYAMREVAKWTERFTGLATGMALLQSLEGSQDLFELAARVHAIEFALLYLYDMNDPREAVRLLEREVLSAARWPTHSTSPMVNYANQCKQARLAQLVHDLQLYTREVAGK